MGCSWWSEVWRCVAGGVRCGEGVAGGVRGGEGCSWWSEMCGGV